MRNIPKKYLKEVIETLLKIQPCPGFSFQYEDQIISIQPDGVYTTRHGKQQILTGNADEIYNQVVNYGKTKERN